MYGWEIRMQLRHYLERGVSKAELSRRFGISRRTIHAWIESGQLDRDLSSGGSRYSPRPRVAHKLDPYKELIEVRLEEFPKLSAKRLFDEVRAAGYDGGYSRVRDFVREVRPRAPQEAPVRFETPAGHQGKVERPIRYVRESFFYGRPFANDADLNEQASRWLEGTANVRRHGTTGERPVDRFERDERQALRPLASHPYRALGARQQEAAARRRLVAPTVQVQRRSLREYSEAVR